MFSTDFILRLQENHVDNQKCQAEFRPLCNKILLMCKNPRNGTNWGFLHNKEVHHNFCETCKDNLDKKSGDLCPLCDSPIDLVVKMS